MNAEAELVKAALEWDEARRAALDIKRRRNSLECQESGTRDMNCHWQRRCDSCAAFDRLSVEYKQAARRRAEAYARLKRRISNVADSVAEGDAA